MTECNAGPFQEQTVFAAELVPYRSLGAKGFRVLLIITAVFCFAHGVFFLVSGAWPIGLFFGVDFLLLWGAFALNYYSGRAREEVTVSRTDVLIRKFAPSGRMVEHRFNPFRARFRVRRHSEIGIVSMYVTGEGRRTDIGSFLNPDDRESFARAMTGAFATVHRRI